MLSSLQVRSVRAGIDAAIAVEGSEMVTVAVVVLLKLSVTVTV